MHIVHIHNCSIRSLVSTRPNGFGIIINCTSGRPLATLFVCHAIAATYATAAPTAVPACLCDAVMECEYSAVSSKLPPDPKYSSVLMFGKYQPSRSAGYSNAGCTVRQVYDNISAPLIGFGEIRASKAPQWGLGKFERDQFCFVLGPLQLQLP